MQGSSLAKFLAQVQDTALSISSILLAFQAIVILVAGAGRFLAQHVQGLPLGKSVYVQ